MEIMNTFEEIKLDFEVITYLNQYHNGGIAFVLYKEIRIEAEQSLFRIEYEANKEEDKETIESFCLCRWYDRKEYDTLEDFLNKEIEYIKNLIFFSYIRKEYGCHLGGILRYFIMWKYNEGLVR